MGIEEKLELMYLVCPPTTFKEKANLPYVDYAILGDPVTSSPDLTGPH